MLDKKELLLYTINEEQGANSVKVLTEFSTKLRERNSKLVNLDEYEDLLEQLITEDKITVIDYVLSKYPDKLKSYILPKCIKVDVHNNFVDDEQAIEEMIEECKKYPELFLSTSEENRN